MAYYITILAQSLTPLVFVSILWSVSWAGSSRAPRILLSWSVATGLALGGLAAFLAGARASETAISTIVNGVVCAFAALSLLVAVLCCLFRRKAADRGATGADYLFGLYGALLAAILAAHGAFDVWAKSVNHPLTVTEIVNTELIVNCFSIAAGLGLLVLLAATLYGTAKLAGRRASTLALVVALALIAVSSSEKLVLGLLRLDMIEVTSGRISYVAKLSLFDSALVYIYLALALVLAIIAFVRRFRMAPTDDKTELRRRKARSQSEARWRRGLAVTAIALMAIAAYQDLVASRPPSLSVAIPVIVDDKGEIRFEIDKFKEGDLHRFSFVTNDGHLVRFFLINRYDPEHVSIGVVYDACMICGDKGYIQNGPEIICIACNVRIFKPSIGKPGGCNPIPLEHRIEGGEIVVSTADLERGARYFSEIVEIEVIDPVSGEKLVNLKAPYQYEFAGRTYFFGTRESLDKFRESPESYVSKDEARYFRVQGHKPEERG